MALGFLESVEKQRQVVPAEIIHEPCKLMIGTPLDEPRNFALIADLVEEPFAPGLTALEGQRRIELVGAGVYPLLQSLAAGLGESRLEQRAIFEDDDIPAEIAEDRFEARPQAFAHDCIEAYTVRATRLVPLA